MLTDEELIAGFEAASLAAFPHADHVRLTILYLARHGRDETQKRLFEGLQRFATAKGVPEKFHVTMTIAWLDLVDDARRRHPGAADASALVTACPELLNRDALLRFYSPERLSSDEARQRWVPPDRLARIEVANQQSNVSTAGLPETERI
jgi:hypothetical protein